MSSWRSLDLTVCPCLVQMGISELKEQLTSTAQNPQHPSGQTTVFVTPNNVHRIAAQALIITTKEKKTSTNTHYILVEKPLAPQPTVPESNIESLATQQKTPIRDMGPATPKTPEAAHHTLDNSTELESLPEVLHLATSDVIGTQLSIYGERLKSGDKIKISSTSEESDQSQSSSKSQIATSKIMLSFVINR